MRMIKTALSAAAVAGVSSPAMAASGPFFSLGNTDFVVLLGLIVFIAILFYYKVPAMIGKMLDARATGIESEINEARALRERSPVAFG